MSISERNVYKGGIVRPENKGLEINCICECESCKQRYEYSKYREHRNVSCRNEASIVVWDEEKIPEAMQIAKKWICKNGREKLKTEYIHV